MLCNISVFDYFLILPKLCHYADDRLAQLTIDWPGVRRFSVETPKGYVRAPGHYAPGVETVSPEPSCTEERLKNPNHFLPVRSHAPRRLLDLNPRLVFIPNFILM